MTGWKEVTAERYDEMLGVLPPRAMSSWGFLVGEPVSHRTCKAVGGTRATWTPLQGIEGRFYEGPDMTFPEWVRLTPHDVLAGVAP